MECDHLTCETVKKKNLMGFQDIFFKYFFNRECSADPLIHHHYLHMYRLNKARATVAEWMRHIYIYICIDTDQKCILPSNKAIIHRFQISFIWMKKKRDQKDETMQDSKAQI